MNFSPIRDAAIFNVRKDIPCLNPGFDFLDRARDASLLFANDCPSVSLLHAHDSSRAIDSELPKIGFGSRHRGGWHTYVDVVELNTVVDFEGSPTLRQVIWWEWGPCGWQVVDWRRLDAAGEPYRVRGGWACQWREHRRTLRVVARSLKTTITEHDPEIDDRARWPMECRRRVR